MLGTVLPARRESSMSTPAPPLVSVVIPAYNAERTIGAAVTGALTQTYERVEVVVVDDGSSDRTRAICEAYGDLITFLSIPNGGTAGARNAAIAAATGDFIALCDADDILLPPHLATMLAAYEAAGGGRRFVHADAYMMTAAGVGHGRTVMYGPTPAPQRQRLEILEANYVSIFALAPAAMFAELGGFTEDAYLEDWDLWLRAVLGGWEVVGSREAHALYRQSETSKSTDKTRVFDAERALLEQVAARPETLRPAERDYLQRRLAARSPRELHDEAETALREGDVEGARRLFAEAAPLWRSNRTLQAKARLMRLPGVPRLWARRVRGVDARLGRTDA